MQVVNLTVDTYVIGATDSDGNAYTIKDIFENDELAKNYILTTDDRFENKPILKYIRMRENDRVSLDKLYNNFKLANDTDAILIKEKENIDRSGASINLNYDNLINVLDRFRSYIKGDLIISDIKVPEENYEDTAKIKKAVDDLLGIVRNSNAHPLLLSEENTTIPKKFGEETTKVFFRVPTLFALNEGLMYDFIPTKSDLEPYPSDKSIYYSPLYPKSGEMTESERDLMYGISDNNTNELYDNEKDFYETLCALIEDASRGTISDRNNVLAYFQTLASYAGERNYMHTGFMPVNISVDDEDDEDSDETEGAESKREFVPNISGKVIDGVEILHEVIAKRYNINPKEAAKTVIQLLRYGSRKPNKIMFEDKTSFNTRIFANDKNTFNPSNATPVINKDGSTVNMTAKIMLSGKSNTTMTDIVRKLSGDSSITMNAPIAFLGYRRFEGTQNIQHVVFTLKDIKDATLSEDSRCIVDLIKYDKSTDKYTVDPKIDEITTTLKAEDVYSKIKSSYDKTFIAYSSLNLMNNLMTINSFSKNDSIFSSIFRLLNESDVADLVTVMVPALQQLIKNEAHEEYSDLVRCYSIDNKTVVECEEFYLIAKRTASALPKFLETDGETSDFIKSYSDAVISDEEVIEEANELQIDDINHAIFEEEDLMKLRDLIIDENYNNPSALNYVILIEKDKYDKIIAKSPELKDDNHYTVMKGSSVAIMNGLFTVNDKGALIDGVVKDFDKNIVAQRALLLKSFVSILFKSLISLSNESSPSIKFKTDTALKTCYAWMKYLV